MVIMSLVAGEVPGHEGEELVPLEVAPLLGVDLGEQLEGVGVGAQPQHGLDEGGNFLGRAKVPWRRVSRRCRGRRGRTTPG